MDLEKPTAFVAKFIAGFWIAGFDLALEKVLNNHHGLLNVITVRKKFFLNGISVTKSRNLQVIHCLGVIHCFGEMKTIY